MRDAIARAEVGDDVFGEDPTVNRLEETVAEILGKEAALYVPSGTMANEVAVAAHTQRGDEVILDARAHIFLHEAAGPALLSGVQLHTLETESGLPRPEQVQSAIRPRDPHFPVSRLLVLENTHNRAGGRVLPLEEQRALSRTAHEAGLRCHLDGARLWNAAAATGRSERELASPYDSVSVCLSKGLGAPVGSLVAGTREFVEAAHYVRKRFGGGMRQAGILAAAGLYAVEHHRARLAEDHRRARRLAEGLARIEGLRVEPDRVETNMVLIEVAEGMPAADAWQDALDASGVRLLAVDPREMRAVTHLDVDDEGIARALDGFTQVARKLAAR
ncbi:MAG: aminotransferase class I/II-fold pyridoxal phosphate-dependent enzyme [Candidatus Eisenbacteria bacterium]|nr:aminotransferase class I/II-fold pyridoxal phosphate-dependent enzyme [Candidatus Eisenbacteria bacterium]